MGRGHYIVTCQRCGAKLKRIGAINPKTCPHCTRRFPDEAVNDLVNFMMEKMEELEDE